MRSRRSTGLGCLSLAALAALTGCALDHGAKHANLAKAPGTDEALARIQAKHQRLMKHGPKRADMPQEAMDFFLEQRLAPGMSEYPVTQVQDAIHETRRRQQQLAQLRGAPPGGIQGWQELGPGNVGGRTRAIVIDPTNDQILYAGGVAGGVFKTTDGGASWRPTGDDLLNLAVSSLIMDHSDPLTLYAGTGEGFFNGDAVRGLGIFKTTDGGETWSQLPGTVEPAVPFGAMFRCNKLAMSPNDSSRIYAATRTAIWRSTDAGETWEAVFDNPNNTALDGVPDANGSFAGFTDLAIRSDTPAGQPDVIFAAAGSFSSGGDGLYRSTDGGDTWTQLGTTADLIRPDQGRMTIDIASSNNDIIYVAMANNGDSGATGQFINVFRSTDGGDTWEPRVDFSHEISPFLFSNLVFGAGCFGNGQFAQGWYDNIIKVDPSDPEVVWVGGVDLFRSDDGAQTFGIASYWWLDNTFDAFVHADQHWLLFHPDYDGVTNTTLFSGSDGGVYRTDNALAPTSLEDCPFDDNGLNTELMGDIVWHTLNNGYGVTQFYHGAAASMRDTYIAGAQDNGTNRVTSTDAINSWTEIFGGDGGYVAIDHQNNDIMYAETQGFPTMIKSTDGGNTWVDATNGINGGGGSFINPFEIDPSNPNILWTGGNSPWRTINGAASWVPAGPNFDGPASVRAIGIAPSDSNTVYLGFSDGYVVSTTNALDPDPTWQIRGGSEGLPEESATISSIAVDPNDPMTAYATSSTFGVEHIYRTTDGGATWTSIDGVGLAGVPEVPVHWIAIRPCDSDQLYVGTEVGVFASDDAGATWQPANQGLANTVVETLVFQDEDTLVAFTHGRGAFITSLASCDAGGCDAGDLNGDGVFNADDLMEFLLLFAAGDPSVDLAPAFGVLDFDDVLAYIAIVAAGCP